MPKCCDCDLALFHLHGVRRCRDISVVGLWAGDMDPDSSLKMLEAVRAKTGISNLRVRERCSGILLRLSAFASHPSETT